MLQRFPPIGFKGTSSAEAPSYLHAPRRLINRFLALDAANRWP